MKRSRFLGLLLTTLLLTTCGQAEDAPSDGASGTERAATTAKQMLALAEAGDWGAYVDRYYGEQEKFASPADRDALVQRFEGAWGARVLVALRRAAPLSPRIEGDTALFEDAQGPAFVLHRTKDGAWSFHL